MHNRVGPVTVPCLRTGMQMLQRIFSTSFSFWREMRRMSTRCWMVPRTSVGVRLPAAHCPLPAICSHRVTTARHIIAHQNVGKDVHLFGPCSGYWVMGHVFKTTVLGVAIDAPPPMEIDSLHRAPIRVEGMLRSEGLLD